MNTKTLYKIGLSLLSLLFIVGCSDDEKDFNNKVYFSDTETTTSSVRDVLFKSDINTNVQVLQSEMARPESYNVEIRYGIDQNKVETYNQAFYGNAQLLDSKYYTLEDKVDVITPGAVKSVGVNLTFQSLSELDLDKVYVLPVSIIQSNVSLLSSVSTRYYVLRGASLIDVVPLMTNNYFVGPSTLANPEPLNGLTQLTMEALVNAKRFDSDGKSFISTVMGIEGEFLLRFGDAGFPMNQLQVATKAGNFPSADESKGVPVNEWFHLAVTFDATNGGKVQVYINGKLQSEGNISSLASVDLGRGGIDGFQIGRSYEDSRFLDGMMSELRVWNVVRTADEIANNFYSVDPASAGLVAYWKCNEGKGNKVADYSASKNDLSSPVADGVTWVPVSLPPR